MMALRREKIIKEAHNWYRGVGEKVKAYLFKEVISALMGSSIYGRIELQDALKRLQKANKFFRSEGDKKGWRILKEDLIDEILQRNFIKDYSDEEILFFFGALYRIAKVEEKRRESLKRRG